MGERFYSIVTDQKIRFAEAYLDRALDEPSVYGFLRWIDKEIKAEGAYDRKDARRLIEALIVAKGGNP